MLLLKPNCERCDKDLAHNAEDAMICSYECTFCRDCVRDVLQNVCPNCGGGFYQRPIRPQHAHRNGVSLRHQPMSELRVNTKFSDNELSRFAESLKHLAPSER